MICCGLCDRPLIAVCVVGAAFRCISVRLAIAKTQHEKAGFIISDQQAPTNGDQRPGSGFEDQYGSFRHVRARRSRAVHDEVVLADLQQLRAQRHPDSAVALDQN